MKTTALITGASSGIGEAFAHIHATRGGDVILVARSKEKLEALKTTLESTHPCKATIIVQDLTEQDAAKNIYDTVKRAGLQVDFLINNAGIGGYGNFHERSLEKELHMIQLNVIALTSLTRLFLTDFTAHNSGKILNVSSTASLMPGPLQAVYFATKAFVTSLSNAIAYELKDTNITVTNLMPGPVDTDFAKSANMEKSSLFKDAQDPMQIADVAYQAMLRGDMDIIAGLDLSKKIIIKASALMPKKLVLKQIYDMQKEQL